MKKFVHTLLFCLLATTFFGQLISIDPEIIEANFENVDLNGSWVDLVIDFHVENISGEVLELKWEREIPDGEGSCDFWDTQCCDNNQCYGPQVSSNVDPELGINIPSVMQVGESYEFAFHVLPKGIAGCCTMFIHFYTVADPNTILKTVEIRVKVNDPTCIVATDEPVVAALSLFPNPVNNQLQITDNEIVETIIIYNAFGQRMKEFEARTSNVFDVSDLAAGVYFVSLLGKEEKVLKTVRVVKQ